MNPLLYEDIVRRALLEDMGFQDLTTEAVISASSSAAAQFLVKGQGVIAGLELAAIAFRLLDPEAKFTAFVQDGDAVETGQVVASVTGRTRALLSAERTALNLLQRLSGIASVTRQAVRAAADFDCQVIDTRKTTPGLRALEKYAVKVGGGRNHRFGLFDAVLIKDNHIAAAGSVSKAVNLVRETVGPMVKIEVETESLSQVEEALTGGADVIMLDNMSCPLMQEAVKLIGGRALTEASGGITLATLREVASTGVKLISLGWLTHSAPALDISLDIAD